MKTVRFLVRGNFGNNLFQYFAAEIIRKIYDYEHVEPTFYINLEFNTSINEKTYQDIIDAYLDGHKIPIDTTKDILMIGYFQRSDIFKVEREYLRGLFNAENMRNISNRIKIGNIVKYKTNHTIVPGENDLTLHLRLGDFYDSGSNTSQIFDPQEIKSIIKELSYEKLYIITHQLHEDWEKEYIATFDELNPIMISGNLGDDFDFMMKSKKIFTSASSVSWMAAFLGDANEVYIPYNSYYDDHTLQARKDVLGFGGSQQKLEGFNDKCKVFYSISYWKPTIREKGNENEES